MPVNKEILAAIESRLEKRGWSKKHLAEECGMSRTALSNLMNSKTTDIQLHTLERIAEALNCTVRVLFEDITTD